MSVCFSDPFILALVCFRLKVNMMRRAILLGGIPFDWKQIMATGTVKWFNATKGYGFIQPDDGSKDVFLHISDVQRAGLDVREGDKLAYDVQNGQQGKSSAGNLRQA